MFVSKKSNSENIPREFQQRRIYIQAGKSPCISNSWTGIEQVFTQPNLNTRGVGRIRHSYGNPRRSRGFGTSLVNTKKVLYCFYGCATTVFTYSYLNTTNDQWKRASWNIYTFLLDCLVGKFSFWHSYTYKMEWNKHPLVKPRNYLPIWQMYEGRGH